MFCETCFYFAMLAGSLGAAALGVLMFAVTEQSLPGYLAASTLTALSLGAIVAGRRSSARGHAAHPGTPASWLRRRTPHTPPRPPPTPIVVDIVRLTSSQDLPPLHVPPGGRGPAGVSDDRAEPPSRCPVCGSEPCDCPPPEVDDGLRRQVRAFKHLA